MKANEYLHGKQDHTRTAVGESGGTNPTVRVTIFLFVERVNKKFCHKFMRTEFANYPSKLRRDPRPKVVC